VLVCVSGCRCVARGVSVGVAGCLSVGGARGVAVGVTVGGRGRGIGGRVK
jgi:hypothetical protein